MDSDSYDSKDYLLDPELWQDRLPQPFQMIDEILQEFLDGVWERIESRELVRIQEEACVKIPEISDGEVLSGNERVKIIRSCKGSSVFIGSPSGLSVLDLNNKMTSTQDHTMDRVSTYEWEKTPSSLIVERSGSVHFVAAAFKFDVKLFAYTKNHLIHLTDVSIEESEGSEINHVVMAPTCTHMAITTSHSEDGTKLQLYQLPLTSWMSEIGQYLEQVCGSVLDGGEGSQVSVTSKQPEEIVYSIATPLCSFQPPSPVTPCTASDPATAMQRVSEDSSTGNCIATGDLHILSQDYLTNRRKAFVSQRADFVEENKEPANYTRSIPRCHFLFSQKKATPCLLTVWWERHTQLLVYPIPNSTLKVSPPCKVLPHTSVIVSSAVSEDGRMVALGQENGAVIVWDMRTGLFTKLVKAVEPPNCITTMEFFEGETNSKIVVGTAQGEILVLGTYSKDNTATSLGHRMSKQKESYPHLFSAYNIESEVVDLKFDPVCLPSVVLSVHANGAAILWSSTEHEALCKVTLPQAFVPAGRQYSCAICEGTLFVIGEQAIEDSKTALFLFDLHTAPTLTPHWSTTPSYKLERSATSDGMVGSIENYLSQFIRTRNTQFKNDKANWQKRWKELPQVLTRQSITAQ